VPLYNIGLKLQVGFGAFEMGFNLVLDVGESVVLNFASSLFFDFLFFLK